jgi:diadenosine tetraphosphatase ApaH/serine/threonine PP2A family protein phosphatase
VAQNVVTSGRTGFRYLSGVTRVLTRQRLEAEDLRFLADLPVTQAITVDGTRFLLVHATPRDPLDEYAPADPDFWSRRLQDVDAEVVCVGHTHQPYVLEVGDKLVINPGSVGQPRDGDPRAAYVMIENNRVEIKRAPYPVEDTMRTIEESTLPDQAKTMLGEVFRTGRSVSRTEDNNHENNKR